MVSDLLFNQFHFYLQRENQQQKAIEHYDSCLHQKVWNTWREVTTPVPVRINALSLMYDINVVCYA